MPVDREWIARQVQRSAEFYRSNPTNPFTPSPTQTGAMEFDGEIPSHSKKGTTYHVTVRPSFASCTCPAFTQFARGRDCSHIKEVKRTLESDAR